MRSAVLALSQKIGDLELPAKLHSRRFSFEGANKDGDILRKLRRNAAGAFSYFELSQSNTRPATSSLFFSPHAGHRLGAASASIQHLNISTAPSNMADRRRINGPVGATLPPVLARGDHLKGKVSVRTRPDDIIRKICAFALGSFLGWEGGDAGKANTDTKRQTCRRG